MSKVIEFETQNGEWEAFGTRGTLEEAIDFCNCYSRNYSNRLRVVSARLVLYEIKNPIAKFTFEEITKKAVENLPPDAAF